MMNETASNSVLLRVLAVGFPDSLSTDQNPLDQLWLPVALGLLALPGQVTVYYIWASSALERKYAHSCL